MRHRGRRGWGYVAPATIRSERERREHLLSLGLVAVLQIAIAASLVVAAVQTYRMWRQGVPYLPLEVQRVVPLALLVGALIALVLGLRSAGQMRSIRRLPLDPGESD